MTTLSPLQQFVQDRILLSIYPGCSIEEAREREKNNSQCLLLSKKFYSRNLITGVNAIYTMEKPQIFTVQQHFYLHRDNIISEVIGLPPSLPRVLHALGENYIYHQGYIYYVRFCVRGYLKERECDRQGIDTNARDQSEETQKAIALLLGWKDE